MDAFTLIREARAGQLQPVYLIYGKETFLRDRAFQAIRRQAVPEELDDLNVTIADGQAEPLEKLLEMVQTMPFLAPYRVVAVKDSPLFAVRRGKADDAAEEAETQRTEPDNASEAALLRYLEHPSPSAVLVFLSGDGVDRRRKAFRSLAARHPAVECQPLREQEMVMWLRDRSEEMGKRLELRAAQEMVQRIPADLGLAESELAKLVAHAGDAPVITADDVTRLVSGVAESNIFELMGYISAKKRARALALLERILREGEPVPRLLFMIARQVRLLLTVKVLAEQGHGQKSIEQRLRLFPSAVRSLLDASRGFSREELVAALGKVLEADVAVKTSQGEPRLVLELLLVDLSA
ncbi:MAG: DNA polymerase III subunit delta [Bacillota bacterium]